MILPQKVNSLALFGSGMCTIIGGIVIWKDGIGGEKADHVQDADADLKDKVYIVTGANTGTICCLSDLILYFL